MYFSHSLARAGWAYTERRQRGVLFLSAPGGVNGTPRVFGFVAPVLFPSRPLPRDSQVNTQQSLQGDLMRDEGRGIGLRSAVGSP